MKRTPSTRFTVLSWVFVAAVAVLIFCMSAKTGDALDHDSGIISFLLEALRSAANALFGHPVDVSPVGHFAEFFLLGLALMNALRLHLTLPKACMLSTLIASLYGASDEFQSESSSLLARAIPPIGSWTPSLHCSAHCFFGRSSQYGKSAVIRRPTTRAFPIMKQGEHIRRIHVLIRLRSYHGLPLHHRSLRWIPITPKARSTRHAGLPKATTRRCM